MSRLKQLQCALPCPYVPVTTAFSQPFWDSLVANRFITTKCLSCNKLSFPPRPVCPVCLSKDYAWTALSGRGRLYTRTRIHAAGGLFGGPAPYTVGIVDLEEGVRLLTRLMHSASSLPLDSVVELVVLKYPNARLFGAVHPDGAASRRILSRVKPGMTTLKKLK